MLRFTLSLALLGALSVALPLIDESGSNLLQGRAVVDATAVVEVETTVDFCISDPTMSCPTTSQFTSGDKDDGQSPGIILRNADTEERHYFIYKNSCECMPVRWTTVPAGGKTFIAFQAGFAGRIMRGTKEARLSNRAHTLGTWTEFSWDKPTSQFPKGLGWADVSLIRGCDGAVTIEALDKAGAKTGFDTWVLDGAPTAAYMKKTSGALAIKSTEKWDSTAIISAPRDWLASKIGYGKAYIDDHHGNPDIRSDTGRWNITFYKGRP